jgi:hypothetical protein
MSHNTSRHDIYAGVHKGLRDWMSQVLVQTGRVDSDDEDDLASCLAGVRALLDACRGHLEHENEFLHPAMEARQPGTAAAAVEDHAHHLEAIAKLEATIAAVEHAGRSERPTHARHLYRELAVFVAENFQHMYMEEAEHNAVLWRHYSDAEIRSIESSLIASIAPDKLMQVLRWMLPAMTPGERAATVGGMQQGMPREAFAGVLEMIKPHLSNRDWFKLQLALGRMPLAA